MAILAIQIIMTTLSTEGVENSVFHLSHYTTLTLLTYFRLTMSVNIVQVENGRPRLEHGEIIKYKSHSSRQQLTIRLKSKDASIKINIEVLEGHVYVTNQRLLYVTASDASRGDIESFSIVLKQLPLLNFSHSLKSGWFGANYWEFMILSPEEGICDGFPKEQYYIGLITFKDGGMYDFGGILNVALNDAVNNPQVDDELPRYSEL